MALSRANGGSVNWRNKITWENNLVLFSKVGVSHTQQFTPWEIPAQVHREMHRMFTAAPS